MREESAFSGLPSSQGQPGPEIVISRKLERIPVLDGWRAVSIILVLAAHLLPLGPKWMQLNFVAGAAGMALFFALSGFLIVQFLAGGMRIFDFAARRIGRIIPLAWAAITILVLWHKYELPIVVRNYLFTANLPPSQLLHGGEHLWSLGVEMQFYLCISIICLVLGRRGLYIIPFLCLGVTCARVISGEPISIVTWHRIDEILSGGLLSLTYSGWLGSRPAGLLKCLPLWPLALALLVCSHPEAGALQYLRPYAAALLVGSSLAPRSSFTHQILESRPMAYVAEISYALYVIHGLLSATWLGAGDRMARYMKRPLLFGATFGLAHLSTRYFEQPITRKIRTLLSDCRPPLKLKADQQSEIASRPCGS